MAKKDETRNAIQSACLEVLTAETGPLHYEELARRIHDKWHPEEGAKVPACNTVYSYLYEEALTEKPVFSFLRKGLFGLTSKEYAPEQLKAAVPERKTANRIAVPEGHRVVFVPEGFDVAKLEKLGLSVA